MKRSIIATILCISPIGSATVKDVYLDREQPVQVHSIFCGQDLKNIRGLKNNYVYTNSDNISPGRYYYSSAYGDFSYVYKAIDGKDPNVLMERTLLTSTQTPSKKEYCIVGKVDGLPQQLTRVMGKTVLSVEDPQWDATMKKLAMFGKPAFAEGVYTDQRTLAKQDSANQKVYDANQAYLKAAKGLFETQFEALVAGLPQRLEDGIAYAYQEDGFLSNKVYPTIKEPAVWTVTAEKRYQQQQSNLHQKKQWDVLIQQNFDWFFALTDKGNKVTSVSIKGAATTEIKDRVFTKVSTVAAKFENGKVLELDFTVTSEEIPASVFWSIDEIKNKTDALRNDIRVRTSRELPTIAPPTELDIYSDAEKMVLFFTPFRANNAGDNYRYF